MSVWGYTRNISDPNKRDSYCPLLFEKILRNYSAECSVKSNRQPVNLKRTVSQQGQKNSQPQKLLIDLNKKVKIVRREFNEEDKENVQDNGATHYDLSSQLNRKHSDILNSYHQEREHAEEKFLDIQEFIVEQKPQVLAQQTLTLNDNKKLITTQELTQQLKLKNFELHEQQVIAENDDLPEIIMPLKELSKCSFLNQLPSQNDQLSINVERYDSMKERQELAEENKSQPHHLKTKISLRILKKKLRTHSLSEIAQDLLKHRRIQFDDVYSQPQKSIICEALLSLINGELIQ